MGVPRYSHQTNDQRFRRGSQASVVLSCNQHPRTTATLKEILGGMLGETYKYFQVQIPSLRCCAIMVCCRMHSRNMASEVTGMRCSFASNIAWIYEEPLRQHVSLKSLPYRGYIAANWPTYMNAHHNFLVMSSSRPSKMQQDCCPSLRRASISPATRYPDYEMHVDVHTAQCYPHAIPPAMS
jgi:hypothetical protein